MMRTYGVKHKTKGYKRIEAPDSASAIALLGWSREDVLFTVQLPKKRRFQDNGDEESRRKSALRE